MAVSPPTPHGAPTGQTASRRYPHSVTWTLSCGYIDGVVTCSAPEGARCREHCPEGCPEWPCGHDLVESGACTALPWLEDDLADLYRGPDVAPTNGPIDLEWCDGSYSWSYAPEEEA